MLKRNLSGLLLVLALSSAAIALAQTDKTAAQLTSDAKAKVVGALARDFIEMDESTPMTAERQQRTEAIAKEFAPAALAKLDAAKSDIEIFYALPGAAAGAFALEQFDLADKLARKALQVAGDYKSNWNFGNAVHTGHTVLGLLALRRGDSFEAIQQLQMSAQTPGSPQLGSFGPSMRLARELLVAGHKDEVLAYLEQCRTFWKLGESSLDIWEKKLAAGAIPNFSMNLRI